MYNSNYSNAGSETLWSMDMAMLMRIDQILTQCTRASIDRKLSYWFELCLALKREVSYMFNEKEEKENTEKIKSLIELNQEYLKHENNIRNFKDYGKYYGLIEDYERFLKQCLYRRGMMIKHKQGAVGAILN